MAFSSWLIDEGVRHRPPASTVSIWMRLAERAAQQVSTCRSTSSVGVDHLRRERLLAREGEQPRRQAARRASPRRSRASTKLVDVGVAALQLAPQQVQRADHHGQHVVEVVGDAAGELADRLHLLHLAHLLLGRLCAWRSRCAARCSPLSANSPACALPPLRTCACARYRDRPERRRETNTPNSVAAKDAQRRRSSIHSAAISRRRRFRARRGASLLMTARTRSIDRLAAGSSAPGQSRPQRCLPGSERSSRRSRRS